MFLIMDGYKQQLCCSGLANYNAQLSSFVHLLNNYYPY